MNVERAKRLGWIVDNLELQYSQINEIHDEERKVLSAVPEGPACDAVRARARRCCKNLADALRALDAAVLAIMEAQEGASTY